MSLQLQEPSICTPSLLCQGNNGDSASCCGGGDIRAASTTTGRSNNKGKISHFLHIGGNPPIDESDVAKELNELSVQERERILDDVHGVATPVHEETTESISRCISEFDIALSRIPKSKRKALDKALFLRPSMMKDTTFKLMFLRSELYDGSRAATKFVKHFEEKLLLFGETRLAKEITLHDLEEEDLDVLNYMGCILLPKKDNVGRPIWFFNISVMDYNRVDSLLRCLWYQVMISITNDDTAQLKGACNLAYCPGSFLKYPSLSKMSEWVKRSNEMNFGFPCRVTSFHFCYDDVSVWTVLRVIRATFGKQIRLRLRTHFGSNTEMQYSLMTFGISCEGLFRGPNNDSQRRAMQNQYMERRRRIEDEESKARATIESNTYVIYPKPEDVLFGRGVPYRDYCGSKRFGKLMDSQLDVYCRCNDKFTKTCMTMDVVKTVQSYGGRFLERKGGEFGDWRIIDDISAREKVAVSFRSRLAKLALSSDGENSTIRMARPVSINSRSIGSSILQSPNNKHQRGTKRLRCDELMAP